MRQKVYFDTHFIDYLWDHRAAIWSDDEASLDKARVNDRSPQIEEYELLQEFPLLAWWNEWFVVVGSAVLEQLSSIRSASRRESLVAYAQQISDMSLLFVEDEPPLIGLTMVSKSIASSINSFPLSDRTLIREALDLGCSVFVTTDRDVLRAGEALRDVSTMRVQRLTEFVDEEASTGRLGVPFGNGPSPSGDIYPDISLYTWFIPPGDLDHTEEDDSI